METQERPPGNCEFRLSRMLLHGSPATSFGYRNRCSRIQIRKRPACKRGGASTSSGLAIDAVQRELGELLVGRGFLV
jgi:hypothetical protein